jgi:hypothetical protein
VGRRRRVIAAYHAERDLADGVGGLQWPDSEAQDVSLLVNPAGELVTDYETVRSHLRVREDIVKRLRRGTAPAGAREWLDGHQLYLFEVKCLLTQSGPGKIAMSAKATARKERAAARYACQFVTVAVDRRRGRKRSGNELYVRRGVGSARLADMTPVADYGELLGHLGG